MESYVRNDFILLNVLNRQSVVTERVSSCQRFRGGSWVRKAVFRNDGSLLSPECGGGYMNLNMC